NALATARRVRWDHPGQRNLSGWTGCQSDVGPSGLTTSRESSFTTSAADAGRSAGFFWCNRSISFDSSAGTGGYTVRAGDGVFSPIAMSVAVDVDAAKAACPVAATYRTLPRLNRSVRASRA